MKIQCSCGAKYNLDVTPDMRGQPIQFVCSTCGRDASDYVTTLVARELDMAGVPAAPAAAAPVGYSNIAPPPPGYAPPMPVAAAAPATLPEPPPPAPVTSGSRLRIHTETHAPAQVAATAVAEPGEAPRCLKHGGELAYERCRVCSKPICPKCMELFGYLCSPLCKAKAEAQNIDVPIFEGQRSVVEAKRARKSLFITLSVCAGVALFIGVWIWYAWFGSAPSKYYAVRFAEPAYSGETAAEKDQLILLHGAILARHDLKQKKEIWSRSLVDKAALEKEVADAVQADKAANDKARSEDPDNEGPPLNPAALLKSLEENAGAELQLKVVGQNIWVISPTKLTLYDWDSGQPAKEIGLKEDGGSVTHRGDEVVVLSGTGPQQHATYINLATKETREEDVTGLPTAPRNSKSSEIAAGGGKGGKSQRGGGLPGLSGKDSGKPMDPSKVAADAQRLSIPGKAVLPAVLANSVHNQQIEKASKDGPDRPVAQKHLTPEEPYELVPTPDGFMRFTSKLLEEKIVTRSAMKAPPTKSALNGDVNVTQTAAVANEILNEMQRNAGYDTVEEDESRYLVKLSSADGKNEWSGEVIGPPHLFPLKTVNVLASNQKIIVFDKQNKKLWDAGLTYNVLGGSREETDASDSGIGQGPCVERNGRLYIFDQGVLTAFDLATGTAAWRVPSVGITGLFFDDDGMLYVNTTDASPESIKYSRQIDVTRMPAGQLLKIHPKTGKVIFKISPPGPVTYVSGKYIYSVQSYTSFDEDSGDSILAMTGMGGTRPFIRIRRLKASNGREMWEHYEPRGPINVQFEKNQIRIVFKKEVEVLKFLSL